MKNHVDQHQLITEVAQKMGVTRKTVAEVYDELVDALLEKLYDGQNVVLTRLAAFELVDRAPQVRRNPQDGSAVNVPAKRVVKVRNRDFLHKVAAPIDENGNPIRDTDEHPAITRRREKAERNAERAAERAAERKAAAAEGHAENRKEKAA